MTYVNPYLHDMLWSLCSSLDADVLDNSVYTHAIMLKITNQCNNLKWQKALLNK